MYPYTLDCYERAVRTEDTRDDVDVLRCYINLGLEHGQSQRCLQQTKRAYWRVVNTLEETACDMLLSYNWRKQAFRFLKRLKPLMFELLTVVEYEAFSKRIRAYSDYFLDSETEYPATKKLVKTN